MESCKCDTLSLNIINESCHKRTIISESKVVDSGAQVTVINKECFKECVRGKQSRPARLKGVTEDNLLMAEVVDDVEIYMGVYQRRIEFLWLIYMMNVSLGCIQ